MIQARHVALLSAVVVMVSPLNPPMPMHGSTAYAATAQSLAEGSTPVTVASSCSSESRDARVTIRRVTEQRGRIFRWNYDPACFPSYYHKQPHFEGLFLEDGRPLPVMGRTCGHFEALVVFVNSTANRQRLLENTRIPQVVKSRISRGEVKEALDDLFATYTSGTVLSGLLAPAVPPAALARLRDLITFKFTVVLTTARRSEFERGATTAGEKLGFHHYDAVVLLDEFFAAGLGVSRWPGGRAEDLNDGARPVFYGKKGTFLLRLNPFWILPGLFGNELLRRNLPQLPSEYLIGERQREVIGATTYDRTARINPRTGENILPVLQTAGLAPPYVYLAGYLDIDDDGVVDCVDRTISPTADNVDADFLPDRLDPDLKFKHTPFFWVYRE